MTDGKRMAGRVVAIAAAPLLATALGGCAGGPAGHDAFVRPADRPECQVASANEAAPQGHINTLDYQRCHPGDSLQWSSERSDTIRPEFGGKRDE